MNLVYFCEFLFNLKTGTIITKCSVRRYKANFLLAYCQGSNVCDLNSRGGEGDFVTDVISFSLGWKLPCVQIHNQLRFLQQVIEGKSLPL